MPIPDFQTIMLPLLQVAADGQEHSNREAVQKLAQHFELSEDERRQLLPSKRQTTFENRCYWAVVYLKKAGLINATRRAHFQITQRGLGVLGEKLQRVDMKYLTRFPEFVEFRNLRHANDTNGSDQPEAGATVEKADSETPEELMEEAHQKIRSALAAELLQQVKSTSPGFFERLVVDLLLRMGYGGTRKDAGEAIGKSGDGGIDGIIKEDRLGLDVIYIQAKKWEDTVGRPEIQKFVGALHGQHASKGVFITTSAFSNGAIEYARSIGSKVVLIDGEMLAQLMIDHNVGVSLATTYEIKRVDSDYFSED